MEGKRGKFNWAPSCVGGGVLEELPNHHRTRFFSIGEHFSSDDEEDTIGGDGRRSNSSLFLIRARRRASFDMCISQRTRSEHTILSPPFGVHSVPTFPIIEKSFHTYT